MAGPATASSPIAAIGGYQSNVNRSKTDEGQASEVNQKVMVDLYVTVPAQRLIFHHELKLDTGTTAGGAAEAVYKVEHGLVCCDSRDVKAINGLAVDPYKEKWWIVLVNGNRQNTSSRTVLHEGDKVEWRYDEKTGYDPAHIRLEDWLINEQQ